MGCGPNEGRGRESETVDGCMCVCASVCRLPALHGEPAHGTERERERDREEKKAKNACAHMC